MTAVGEAGCRETPRRRSSHRLATNSTPTLHARVTAHEDLGTYLNFTMAEPSVGGAPAASRQSPRSLSIARGDWGNPVESGNPIGSATASRHTVSQGDSWVGGQLRLQATGCRLLRVRDRRRKIPCGDLDAGRFRGSDLGERRAREYVDGG